MNYKPSEDSRTSGETLQHVLGLSETILNAVQNKPNIRPKESVEMTFAEKREQTLANIKAASDYLRKAATGTIEESKIISSGERIKQNLQFGIYIMALSQMRFTTLAK